MKIEKLEFNYSPKTEPLSHQIDAIEFIKKNRNIPLFDEQGLGKSKTVIDALCSNIEKKELDCALIVCKKTLLFNWQNEINFHSHLFPVVISGTKTRRARSYQVYAQFYIINYESLVEQIEVIKLLLENRKCALVLDESQKIKNPDANVTKTILSIKDLPKKKIIITGTPIANKPEDIWSQFYFLDGGELLGRDFQVFKKKYKLHLKGETDLDKYQKRLLDLRERIESASIRRTKDVLDLPEKKYVDVVVELSPIQKEIYDTARQELSVEIENDDGDALVENIENYLVKLLRLTQIASNPGLLNENYQEIPSKVIELDRLLSDIVDNGEKAIVWTSFRRNIRALRKRYSKFGALMLFGDIQIKERATIVEKFMNESKNKVLIANPAAAKEGLTLTSANNAIYLDRNFKMDDYLQSQDRIHRISQRKKCQIIKLIAKDTIDEYTDEILEKKQIIAQFALGDADDLNIRRTCLTKEDLLRILG